MIRAENEDLSIGVADGTAVLPNEQEKPGPLSKKTGSQAFLVVPVV